MRMSKDSYDGMNRLVAMCFNANAVFDNLAYCLDYHYYTKIADIVHHSVAHVMPEWADLISDKMLQLSGRPVRMDINGYEKDYEDIGEIFDVMNGTLFELRGVVRNLIESADLDGDDEVRIFAEEFLQIISPFIKQAEEWKNAALKLDGQTLNIHIKDYTHFIDIR